MLGYVIAEKAELKMREYEVYSAYYCGICKSVGKRYGQLPRLTLNYDFAFLALLLASVDSVPDEITAQHCMIHPIKRKNIAVNNKYVDYAGDMMLILVYYNLLDDVADEKNFTSRVAVALFHNNYTKLKKKYSKICKRIEEQLTLLGRLEKQECDSLDCTGETFSVIMGELFTEGIGEDCEDCDMKRKALAQLGRFIGKWIYLADAWDDLEKDMKNKVYNPLIFRFAHKAEEPVSEFRNRIREKMEFSMMSCLAEIGKACDLLSIKKNKGIVENIVYFGLLRKTEQLLKKGTEENEGSI